VGTETPITVELAEFLQSGLAIVLATRDGDFQADGAVAWAAVVQEDRRRLRVFLHALAGKEMLRNLRSHPEIAVNFDKPTTHRACQVKGTFLSSRAARPSERAMVDRQVDGFASELEAIGIPRPMTAGWKTWPCSALEMTVTHVYEQTPGPGSGEPLR